MRPVLFELGGIPIYSYGLMIALGVVAGVTYMAIQGKKDVGLSFDQANLLFVWIFLAAFMGGKVFLFFEDPSRYVAQPQKLLSGNGFVFYGSFLFAVPTMLLFFKKHHLHVFKMLDVMAITTCLVHMFGRVGCFLAGCCYGTPTTGAGGVIFTDPACPANPKGVPLHPVQHYEAMLIFLIMIFLLFLRERKSFYGQLFLTYLFLYGVVRYGLEFLRGDRARGFVIEPYLSHSQLIAIAIIGCTIFFYFRLGRDNPITKVK